MFERWKNYFNQSSTLIDENERTNSTSGHRAALRYVSSVHKIKSHAPDKGVFPLIETLETASLSIFYNLGSFQLYKAMKHTTEYYEKDATNV
jgi:hypothetical protein